MCLPLKDVSVIISVYSIGRANDVMDCIGSIKNQTLAPEEIIVALDPDEKLVSFYKKSLKKDVRIVVSDAFGLSSARNTGIRNSQSELIAFIDDDAVADRDWLKKLVKDFGDSSVIGVGGRIVPIWPERSPGWFPEVLYWIVGCSYKGLPTKKDVIRNPIGCNMVFRRSVFEEVGCFSTSVGRIGNKLLGHDDTEFGIRAKSKLAGTKIIYDPEAVVYHRVSLNRVSLKYVLKRSYAEGFSKAVVSHGDQVDESTLNTEKEYLHNLLLSAPSMLFQGNLQTGASQYATLWVVTIMVFLGYIVGARLGRKYIK
jgi:GT2 family glycosyltransferase